MNKLRWYQEDAHVLLMQFMASKEQRGKVYMPTGAGKTESFIYLLKAQIKRQIKLSKAPLRVAVLHPRLALSQDQLKRFQRSFGKNVVFTSFHSGDHVNSPGKMEFSTLDPNRLINIQDNTVAAGKTHITFSSYHSFDKLAGRYFDIVICDEAHYVTQLCFKAAVDAIDSPKILFFTATPIDSEFLTDRSSGMNNLAMFGREIYSIAPGRLIPHGYIVAPKLHQLEVTLTDDTKGSRGVDGVKVTAEAFIHQREEMRKTGMPYTKMLVATTGNAQINEVVAAVDELKSIVGHDVRIYTVTAEGMTVDGRTSVYDSRPELLDDFSAHDGDSIILHINTLAEGIDISSITGVLLLRELSKSKMLQTIGRAARPHKTDLINDVALPFEQRKKQRCIVSVPIVDGVPVFDSAEHIAEAFMMGGYDASLVEIKKDGEDTDFFGDDDDDETPIIPDESRDHMMGKVKSIAVNTMFDDIESLLGKMSQAGAKKKEEILIL